MTAASCFRIAILSMALVAVSVAVPVASGQSTPLSEGTTGIGGAVSQSGNCPAERQADGHCLPGGPGNPAGSDSTPTPPVTPPIPLVTPPVVPPTTLPITPPSGRPSATRPEEPELPEFIHGWATATFHIHDGDHDVTYTSTPDPVKLIFQRRSGHNQDIRRNQNVKGNTQ